MKAKVLSKECLKKAEDMLGISLNEDDEAHHIRMLYLSACSYLYEQIYFLEMKPQSHEVATAVRLTYSALENLEVSQMQAVKLYYLRKRIFHFENHAAATAHQ